MSNQEVMESLNDLNKSIQELWKEKQKRRSNITRMKPKASKKVWGSK